MSVEKRRALRKRRERKKGKGALPSRQSKRAARKEQSRGWLAANNPAGLTKLGGHRSGRKGRGRLSNTEKEARRQQRNERRQQQAITRHNSRLARVSRPNGRQDRRRRKEARRQQKQRQNWRD
jgi:hypothetical protein